MPNALCAAFWHPQAQRASIVSSLTLQLNALRATDPGSALTLYASAAGAFLDLAADLNQAFRLGGTWLPSTGTSPRRSISPTQAVFNNARS